MSNTSPRLRPTAWSEKLTQAVTRLDALLSGRAGWTGLALLSLLTVGVWLVLGREITFRGDDVDHLLNRSGWRPAGFLEPHVGHLVAVQVLYERAMWSTVGLAAGWPYLLCNGLAWSAAVIGTFLLVRRHAGPWVAAGGCAVLLVLAAGAEDLLWPFQFGNLISMTAGVWALIALDRRSRRNDALACLAVSTSVAASSYGLIFLGAIALELLVARRWRRTWIVLLPLVLYAVWRLSYEPSTGYPLAGPALALRFAFDYLSWTFAAFGVLPLAWGRVLAAACVAGTVGVLVLRRPLDARTLTVMALPALTLLLTAVARGTLGQPQSGRYVLPLALLLVLLAGRLLPRWRPSLAGVAIFAVVVMGAGAANLRTARDASVPLRGTGKAQRTALGALTIARPSVPPQYTLLPPSAYGADFRADRWFSVTDYYGSTPAYDLEQLLALPPGDRAFADNVLATAEQLRFGPPSAAVGGPRPSVGNTGADVRLGGSCATVTPASTRLTDVVLSGSGVLLRASPGDELVLRARRLGPDVAPAVLSTTTARASEVLVPRDALRRPWVLQIEHGERLAVCGRATGA